MDEDPSEAGNRYFLSYSRSDEAFALRLARDLRAQGVAMWVDQLDIRPSEHWDRAIERAVRACEGILVILSPRSVASDNVADEISFAIDSGKSVLPVMIEQCTLPLRITRMQVIDGTRNYSKALDQCVAELRKRRTLEHSSPGGGEPRQPLDETILLDAKRRLIAVVGPIGGVLVDKAALRASSAPELYAILGLHIDDAHERERFLSSLKSSANESSEASADEAGELISPEEISELSKRLTLFLGPVAPLLVKRERSACTSLDDLELRLSALIPTEDERTQFMRGLRPS